MSTVTIKNVASILSVMALVGIIVATPDHRTTAVIMLVAVLLATLIDRWWQRRKSAAVGGTK